MADKTELTFIDEEFGARGTVQYVAFKRKAHELAGIQLGALDLLRIPSELSPADAVDELMRLQPKSVAGVGGVDEQGEKWAVIACRAKESGQASATSFVKPFKLNATLVPILAHKHIDPDSIDGTYYLACQAPLADGFELTSQIKGLVAELCGMPLARIATTFTPRCAFPGEDHPCQHDYFDDVVRAWSEGRLPLEPPKKPKAPQDDGVDYDAVFATPELSAMGLGPAERATVEMILRIRAAGDDSAILRSADGYHQQEERQLARNPMCPLCGDRTKSLYYSSTGEGPDPLHPGAVIAHCAAPSHGPVPTLACDCGWRGIDARQPKKEDVVCPQCGQVLTEAFGSCGEDEGACQCGWTGEYIANSMGQLMTLMGEDSAQGAIRDFADGADLDDDTNMEYDYGQYAISYIDRGIMIDFPTSVSIICWRLRELEEEIYRELEAEQPGDEEDGLDEDSDPTGE